MNDFKIFGSVVPDPQPFPFEVGDKITADWMSSGGYITIKSVGDWSFAGVVHGARDWKIDGTEIVLGFNLDWRRYGS